MKKPKQQKSACRHAAFWAIFGGIGLWCPDCGALRRMAGQPWKRWVRPNGNEAANNALLKV